MTKRRILLENPKKSCYAKQRVVDCAALQAVAESRDTGDLSTMEDPQALQQVVDVMQGG